MSAASLDKLLVIGEIGQAHDGSLGFAHAYIDAIADAGADAVKFQTHLAAEESTPAEPWRVKFSKQDATRYDYWRRMEFSEEQWAGLVAHARERELLFVSSPFSQAAVDLLRRVGVDVWKVASGEVADARLLRALLGDERLILLSSGMSPWSELDRAVEDLRGGGNPFALLQCSSRYPCPPKSIGLNVLGELRERYGAPVGLSDHSGTIFPGLAAVTLGASVVEVHVTMHRACFGPDVPASLTLEELAELVRGVRFIEKMMKAPVDKDQMAEELAPMRALFTKSLVASRDLAAGTVLSEADLAVKKPGSGLPGERLPEVVGRRLVRAVKRDALLAEEDLER